MGSSLVSVLDTRSGALEAEIRLPATDVLDLAELVLDAKNSRLYVTATGLGYSMVFGGNSMTALDTHTGVILSNVDVPSTPPA